MRPHTTEKQLDHLFNNNRFPNAVSEKKSPKQKMAPIYFIKFQLVLVFLAFIVNCLSSLTAKHLNEPSGLLLCVHSSFSLWKFFFLACSHLLLNAADFIVCFFSNFLYRCLVCEYFRILFSFIDLYFNAILFRFVSLLYFLHLY